MTVTILRNLVETTAEDLDQAKRTLGELDSYLYCFSHALFKGEPEMVDEELSGLLADVGELVASLTKRLEALS